MAGAAQRWYPASAHNKGMPLTGTDTETLVRETVLECCRRLLADYKMPRKLLVRHTPLDKIESSVL